jgi:hypothetical protein
LGAHYLDKEIVQQVINIENSSKGKNPALLNWHSASSGIGDSFPHGLTRLPVFIAMSTFQDRARVVTNMELEGLRIDFLAVLDALISSMELFQFPFSKLESDLNVWVEEVLLANECCDQEMVTRMARAGFALPWKLLRWGSDRNIRISPDGFISQVSTLKVDTVLGVICSGQCRLVDILGANLNFAEGLLRSGLITTGSLILNGDELEILALLPKFHGAGMDLLRELIRLGFNPQSALMQAAEEGLEEGVELLLQTLDGTILANVATAAYNLAWRNGFEKVAEMLAAFVVEGVVFSTSTEDVWR